MYHIYSEKTVLLQHSLHSIIKSELLNLTDIYNPTFYDNTIIISISDYILNANLIRISDYIRIKLRINFLKTVRVMCRTKANKLKHKVNNHSIK